MMECNQMSSNMGKMMRARFPVLVLLLLLGVVFLLAFSIGVAYGEKDVKRPEEEEEGEWRGRRRHQDPEERERVREREEISRRRRRRKEHREEEERQSGSESRRQRNPYHFSTSTSFHTRYRNMNGHIRVLERFDNRTNQLENLQNYRIVEFQSKPKTLILPHHSDADHILILLNGRATITVVNSYKRQAYNLESGDAFRVPAATTLYILNPDDNHNLRLVKLVIPVNNPGKFDDFFPSSTQGQQSYFRGFSRNTLEATFNTRYEEIEMILLGDEEEGGREDEGLIVRVSKKQIQELRKHAQSASKRGKPSESGPFNLRSNKPMYSNEFGNLYEITPDTNPQLQDLDISLTFTQINEGALFLPHYNSKAIFVAVVDEGEGNYELVGLREQQENSSREVRRYRANLSEGDIFVIPAGHPFSIKASSNLRLLGFGINADENQRNFLAGWEDNVIRQLDRQVKELTFPGSALDVEILIETQKQSYFANAQLQQEQREKEPSLQL